MATKVSFEVKQDAAASYTAGMIKQRIITITVAYAKAVQAELNRDKPAYPKRGSMVFVSEKQRRYVMAAIKEGRIKVPYKRGLRGETLSKSYRIDVVGFEAYLLSAASYAKYVVGDEQARIHQGRWKTAVAAAETVRANGTLQYIIDNAK